MIELGNLKVEVTMLFVEEVTIVCGFEDEFGILLMLFESDEFGIIEVKKGGCEIG
jgi:hypothetical protein